MSLGRWARIVLLAALAAGYHKKPEDDSDDNGDDESEGNGEGGLKGRLSERPAPIVHCVDGDYKGETPEEDGGADCLSSFYDITFQPKSPSKDAPWAHTNFSNFTHFSESFDQPRFMLGVEATAKDTGYGSGYDKTDKTETAPGLTIGIPGLRGSAGEPDDGDMDNMFGPRPQDTVEGCVEDPAEVKSAEAQIGENTTAKIEYKQGKGPEGKGRLGLNIDIEF